MVKTKSVRSPIDREDGLRILVARFRGRGLPASRYHVWMPNLGPSETLLRDWQGGALAWRDYARRYRQELFSAAAVDRANRTIKNHGQKFSLRLIAHLAQRDHVMLLCHCAEDEPHCHRHLLKALLEGGRAGRESRRRVRRRKRSDGR